MLVLKQDREKIVKHLLDMTLFSYTPFDIKHSTKNGQFLIDILYIYFIFIYGYNV